VLRVVTTDTGGHAGTEGDATCAPLQEAFTSAPFLTRTSLQVAPDESL
jgi:hypothetical protein